MARLVRAAVAAFGVLLYLWYAAVRSLPRVKRKKQRAR
jgi:hypothetical protein